MTSGRPDGIDKPTAPQMAPEYDFSTPKKAAESMIKAAKKGDEAAFKRGISNRPPHSPTPIPVLTAHGAAGAKANSLQSQRYHLRGQ